MTNDQCFGFDPDEEEESDAEAFAGESFDVEVAAEESSNVSIGYRYGSDSVAGNNLQGYLAPLVAMCFLSHQFLKSRRVSV